MKLENLHLYANYGANEGAHGTIHVKGRHGEIILNLNPDQCQRLLNVIMVSLIEEATKVAHDLSSSLIDNDQPSALGAPNDIPDDTPTPDLEDYIPF